MDAWRISNHADLAGTGAELSDGRWHTAAPGKRMVYLAEHPAVALIESLANLVGETQFFPDQFQLLRVAIPANVMLLELTTRQLRDAHRANLQTTQAIGDAWLAARASALLRVPSVPAPESWNYLLNPLHPEAAHITVKLARRIAYDKRLFHLKGK